MHFIQSMTNKLYAVSNSMRVSLLIIAMSAHAISSPPLLFEVITQDIKNRSENIHKLLNHEDDDGYCVVHTHHANNTTSTFPVAQHHAWRDTLSASPIEVAGSKGFSTSLSPRAISLSVDMVTSESRTPIENNGALIRQSSNANKTFQLSSFGENKIEECFRKIGKRIVENYRQDVDVCSHSVNPPSEDNIFSDSTPKSHDHLSDAPTIVPNHHRNNFVRHFQINEARLANIQRTHGNSDEDSKLLAIRLSCEVKRMKIGIKDRVLCMVVDCDKHAQTRCDGCCTAHFRLLSSTLGIGLKVCSFSCNHMMPIVNI